MPSSAPDPTRRARPAFSLRRVALFAGFGLALLLIVVVADVLVMIPLSPGVDDLREAQVAKPSVLLTADGQTLATFSRAQQAPMPLNRISPQVVQALLATEDRRFYEHGGVDLRRTAGAFFHTLGGDTQGGSTITQQLARNLFPEDIGRARNLNRKVKEAITAVRIERTWTKPQILETYLNTAPFLYNVVGIEMAARTYFDRSAADLGPLEAATLIGMLKGTHYYNPVINPERAIKRRNVVLAQMVKTGALTAAACAELQRQPLQVKLNRQPEELGIAPHFAAHARKWLIDWADAHDYNLDRDGLVIQTTIDSRLQAAATQAVARQAVLLQQVADVEWSQAALPVLGSTPQAYTGRQPAEPFRHFFNQHAELLDAFIRETPEYKAAGRSDAERLQHLKADAAFMARLRRDKTRLEAGFVAMDPATGAVRAWVGSRDFQRDQFDHVAQAERQPGSTFKPIVYGAALEMGFSPERSYMDGPVEVSLGNGAVWRPTDMHGFSNQPMSLREGLVYSKNTITAQVAQDVGVQRIVTLAQAMGVTDSHLDPVPSLALGTSPVTLLEMVDAYSTIAAQGTRHPPLLITRITDAHGQVLADFGGESSRALSPQTAVELIDMLRGVVNRGTGTAVKTRFGIVADIAGKTGTTQNNTDGWFILMHPNLVAGAWVGFNDSRVTMRSDYWGQGGHNAILLVGDFFRDALGSRLLAADAAFPQPERRAPLVAPGASWPADDWAAAGSAPDEAASAASAPEPATVTVHEEGGKVLIGDEAGLAAMRREAGPPKSAEEIDRAVGAMRAASAAGAPASEAARLPPVTVDARSGILVPRVAAVPAAETATPPAPEAAAASSP